MKKVTKTIESITYAATIFDKSDKSIKERRYTVGSDMKMNAVRRAISFYLSDHEVLVDVEEVERVSGLYAIPFDKFYKLSVPVDKPSQGYINRSCEVVEYEVILYNKETRSIETAQYIDYESSSESDLLRHYRAVMDAAHDPRKIVAFEPVSASVTMRALSLPEFIANAERVEKAE